MVLQNPSVDTAVFEVARGGILREGLGYDRNDVAVVTNVTADHLGLHGVETMAQLAHVKAVLVEAVPRAGTAVLNADDPLVARMARQCARQRHLLLDADRARARRASTASTATAAAAARRWSCSRPTTASCSCCATPIRTMPLLYTHLIPATFGGRARMNVANALAAAAAAWAAGAHLHDIRQGLRTFSTSFFQAPGRLNEVDVDGYKVILDYCHNVDGMRRLTEFVELMIEPAAHGNGSGQRATASRRRSASSASPATGATRTIASTAASPRTLRRDLSCARTATCAAASRASPAELVKQGVEKGMGEKGGAVRHGQDRAR